MSSLSSGREKRRNEQEYQCETNLIPSYPDPLCSPSIPPPAMFWPNCWGALPCGASPSRPGRPPVGAPERPDFCQGRHRRRRGCPLRPLQSAGAARPSAGAAAGAGAGRRTGSGGAFPGAGGARLRSAGAYRLSAGRVSARQRAVVPRAGHVGGQRPSADRRGRAHRPGTDSLRPGRLGARPAPDAGCRRATGASQLPRRRQLSGRQAGAEHRRRQLRDGRPARGRAPLQPRPGGCSARRAPRLRGRGALAPGPRGTGPAPAWTGPLPTAVSRWTSPPAKATPGWRPPPAGPGRRSRWPGATRSSAVRSTRHGLALAQRIQARAQARQAPPETGRAVAGRGRCCRRAGAPVATPGPAVPRSNAYPCLRASSWPRLRPRMPACRSLRRSCCCICAATPAPGGRAATGSPGGAEVGQRAHPRRGQRHPPALVRSARSARPEPGGAATLCRPC